MEGDFKEKGVWCPGVISCNRDDGTYNIEYDDNSIFKEYKVPPTRIRRVKQSIDHTQTHTHTHIHTHREIRIQSRTQRHRHGHSQCDVTDINIAYDGDLPCLLCDLCRCRDFGCDCLWYCFCYCSHFLLFSFLYSASTFPQ